MSSRDRRGEYQRIPDDLDDEEEEEEEVDEGIRGEQQPQVQFSPRKRTSCFCVSGVLFLILLAIAVTILTVLLLVVGNQPPRVTTACGDIEGYYDNPTGVFVFKGIPFAAPPMKELRWKPPVPLSQESGTCWSGLLKARDFKPACPQPVTVGGTRKVLGWEDCLHLNIFTPSLAPLAGPLPVMVYIHGGNLQTGSASTPGSSPDPSTASDLNAVLISIQYRLGPLGFLVIDELLGNGNYGHLDQIAALRWIQENVATFGGDPKNVTLFGVGSGGSSVWSLMMTPRAKGLFHRAWSLSPSPLFNKTLAEAKRNNAFFVKTEHIQKRCGVNVTESCLQFAPVSDVLYAVTDVWPDGTYGFDLPTKGTFDLNLPVIDGDLFPDSAVNLLANRSTQYYSDVPIILGTTTHEADLLPTPFIRDPTFATWDNATFYKYLAHHLDPFGLDAATNLSITNTTRGLYGGSGRYADKFTTIVTDARAGCAVSELARHAARAFNSPVYRYVVDAAPSSPVTALSAWRATLAFHGWDAFAFFGGFSQLYELGTGASASDRRFQANLRDEIRGFVATGKVSTAGWLPFPNRTALLGETTRPQDAYHRRRCEFWTRNGFPSYGWNN